MRKDRHRIVRAGLQFKDRQQPPRSRNAPPLITAKTAAASVAETIAPSSNPSSQESPSTTVENHPTSAAVISTPIVESEIAGQSAGRTCGQCVSNPPAKRIKRQRQRTDKLRHPRIVEVDAAGTIRPRQHADQQKQQQRRNANPPATLPENTASSNNADAASTRCAISGIRPPSAWTL